MNVGKYLRGEDRHVGTARVNDAAESPAGTSTYRLPNVADPQNPPDVPQCCGGKPNCDALEYCLSSAPTVAEMQKHPDCKDECQQAVDYGVWPERSCSPECVWLRHERRLQEVKDAIGETVARVVHATGAKEDQRG